MSRKKTHKSDISLFARNIESLAEAKGGKYAFAASIGVVYDSVRRWCNGENMPDGQQLLTIKEKFGISLDWLIGEDTSVESLSIIAEKQAGYAISQPPACPVDCNEKLREICRAVKYVLEKDSDFAEALTANIKAFRKSVEMERRMETLEKSLSEGVVGGIPQKPARSTAKRRKAGLST